MTTTTTSKSATSKPTKSAKPSRPAGSKSKPQAKVFQLDQTEMKIQEVAWKDIFARADDFGFRKEGDADPYSKEALRPLKESIKFHRRVHTPLLLRDTRPSYLVADGHRRYFAVKQLIEEGVKGFTPEMMLPAHVMESKTSDLVMVATALSANIERQPLGFEGRLDATLKLHKLGMPKASIAQVLRTSESTVERDLILAKEDAMRDCIRRNHITATNAAKLLATADKANRKDEFIRFLIGWIMKASKLQKAEEKARAERDEPPLSGSKAWLKNRMTQAIVTRWRRALETGQPLDMGDFGLAWPAGLSSVGKHGRLEIGAVSKGIDELTAADLAKIVQRCYDLASDIEPVLVAKVKAEKKGADREPSPGVQRLKELGLASLVGESEEIEEEDAEPDDEQEAEADSDEEEAEEQTDSDEYDYEELASVDELCQALADDGE
jgi:ParB-like chromosome segregation protein Spo0J